VAERNPLSQPGTRGWLPKVSVDSETFGTFAESFARFMGTAKFLVYMTVFVIVWVTINLVGLFGLKWDPYPFIALNLFFSTQASYSAPLILLAQNRQENRDRVALDEDRVRAAETKADTEFLARELAAVRLAVGDTVTRDYLRKELDDLIDELAQRLRQPQGGTADGAAGTGSAAPRQPDA
jgi:uncharacterized membrane protein